jgi:hypothetical protein
MPLGEVALIMIYFYQSVHLLPFHYKLGKAVLIRSVRELPPFRKYYCLFLV